jgi:hypothetical protein
MFATEQTFIVAAVVMHQLSYIPEKKLTAACTDNRNLLPFLFTFITAKFLGTDSTAYWTAVLTFHNTNITFGRKSLFLQYLKNTLS